MPYKDPARARAYARKKRKNWYAALSPEAKKANSRRQAAADKERRERRRAEGKCTRCEEPAIPGRSMCPKHAAKRSTHQANRRARLHAEKKCQDCGSNPVEFGRALCDECVKPRSKAQAARRRSLRDAGLCVDCGKISGIKIRCDKCAAAQAERNYRARLQEIADKETARRQEQADLEEAHRFGEGKIKYVKEAPKIKPRSMVDMLLGRLAK